MRGFRKVMGHKFKINLVEPKIHSKSCTKRLRPCAIFPYLQDSVERLLMLDDLQGSRLKLYDPEIATVEELEGKDLHVERFFCGGNLNDTAIDFFFRNHKCNIYFKLASLKKVEMEEIADDSH